MQPKPTETKVRLVELPDVRAVLFDIYGTLMISGSGDIGSDQSDHRRKSLKEVLKLLDLDFDFEDKELDRSDKFAEVVRAEHERAKLAGVEYPEVDYREIWSCLLYTSPSPRDS